MRRKYMTDENIYRDDTKQKHLNVIYIVIVRLNVTLGSRKWYLTLTLWTQSLTKVFLRLQCEIHRESHRKLPSSFHFKNSIRVVVPYARTLIEIVRALASLLLPAFFLQNFLLAFSCFRKKSSTPRHERDSNSQR